MKKKILIGSTIAVAIILLSSFSSVVGKVSTDNELVEFDVEFSGLGKKHTVKLTQQEAEEVEQLFDDIEQQLSKVETREEAEIIFKDAVVELDKYGLLGGLSVKQVQRLFLGRPMKQRAINLMGKTIKNTPNGYRDYYNNSFCLLSGHIGSYDALGVAYLMSLLISVIGSSLENLLLQQIYLKIAEWLYLKPIHIYNYVMAHVLGNFTTIGIQGIKVIPDICSLLMMGFSGLIIVIEPFFHAYVLGYARVVKAGD